MLPTATTDLPVNVNDSLIKLADGRQNHGLLRLALYSLCSLGAWQPIRLQPDICSVMSDCYYGYGPVVMLVVLSVSVWRHHLNWRWGVTDMFILSMSNLLMLDRDVETLNWFVHLMNCSLFIVLPDGTLMKWYHTWPHTWLHTCPNSCWWMWSWFPCRTHGPHEPHEPQHGHGSFPPPSSHHGPAHHDRTWPRRGRRAWWRPWWRRPWRTWGDGEEAATSQLHVAVWS